MGKIQNILIGIDFRDDTRFLIEEALRIIEPKEAKIWLLHIAAPDPDFVSYKAGPQSERDLRAEELKKEHKLLSEYASFIKEKGLEAEGLLIQGTTGKKIIDKSNNLGIDLIILGYHKHGLLYKTFLGNTADDIIKKSKIPILVIPLKEQ